MQNEEKASADFLAPAINEVVQHRGRRIVGSLLGADALSAQSTMTRAVARRLLPACVAAPALVWWALFIGQHQGWYDAETSFTLFVFSITAVFGLIVCMNLRRLARMDVVRAETEEQLKIAKEAAETANRFRSAFFANISHEIRTPLTAINGFAELMVNPDRTQDERLADARVIRRNGEHLLTLINDILDLSKIEAGKMSVEQISCCPATIVSEVCTMLRHRAAQKTLSLDVKFAGPIPTHIRTDPTRLRQSLINLVSNAVKFTKSGGVTVTVSLERTDHKRPMLRVQISDTGIGISAEQLQNLFQPFVQGDASITRQYGGTGLGLTISRHFCRALGGDVTVTSEPGKGSTFVVTVETGSLAGTEMLARPEAAMEAQASVAQAAEVRISGSVLVAEDGADNQALIAAKLRRTGLKVEIAPNGQVAFDLALAAMEANRPFDVILMDVQMPVMDGYTATLQLRGKGYRGPIIALTANAMERDREKCLNAGCNDFVTKPIHFDKLVKAMGRYVAVEQVAAGESAHGGAGAKIGGQSLVESFCAQLPDELAQIEEAMDRQDSARLTELVQLIVGKAAAAGLKDLAAQAAGLVKFVRGDGSREELRSAVRELAREADSRAKRRAA